MASYTTSAKHALRRLTGGSLVNEIDTGFEALSNDLDAIIATDDQGTFAARPISTAGAPGKKGRYFYATDTQRLYRDHGSGWSEIGLGWSEVGTGPKIIRGNVDANGTIAQGTGFTVVRNGVGTYTVSFSAAFASPPSVTVAAIGLDKSAVLGGAPVIGSAQVLTANVGGAASFLTDTPFNFIAIGPA